MTVLKLAAVTCAFYLLIAALLQALMLALVYLRPGILFHASRLGWAILFGFTWIVSFSCACRTLGALISNRLFSN